MASSSKMPTILLVQGSFQLPEVYQKLTMALEAKGYPVVHPPLPSLSDPENPDFASKSLVTDALAIQLELKNLIEQQERTVVVLMHSYGGLVGSEATSKEFSWAYRKGQGLTGDVIHFFFFAAFILAEGQSVLSGFGESSNIDVRPHGRFRIKDAAKILYNDLPPEEAEYWASKIIDQSYAVQTTKLSRAAYRYIPSTYVICENDKGPPPQFQEVCGKNAKAEIRRMNSGHSPMLSKTDELVKLITVAAGGAMKMAI
ncbi:alpha/beta-hydrolase [Biscogniauxia marginata]|nr:alpha/beta-hydrolase [Biscogniauxia marginata]